MDLATIVGIILGLGSLFIGMSIEGINILALFKPSAFMIVVPSTFGVAIASGILKEFPSVVAALKRAFTAKIEAGDEAIRTVVKFAEQARREGLLSLEDATKSISDPFLKKGIELAVDGTDPEELREILELEIISKKERDKVGIKFFGDLGGFAPTLGIIGTVLGLVHVLANLNSKPDSLGPAISTAFIATLYGVGSANLLYLPISNKLKRLSDLETHHMDLIVEGVLSIQAGANPRVIEQKLLSFLSPQQREAIEKERAA